MSVAEHDLYHNGDPDAPAAIKDANGDVVLGLCRRCGRAEAELTEPCAFRTSAAELGLVGLDQYGKALRDVGTAFRNMGHFSSRCELGRPPRYDGPSVEVGEVEGVVIQGMVDCSKAGMLRADDATDHMKAQEADWQRVCDALGAKGEHMDPDDVVKQIEHWVNRDAVKRTVVDDSVQVKWIPLPVTLKQLKDWCAEGEREYLVDKAAHGQVAQLAEACDYANEYALKKIAEHYTRTIKKTPEDDVKITLPPSELVQFFRSQDGHWLAKQGGEWGWTPEHTAVVAMKELLAYRPHVILPRPGWVMPS